MKRYPYVPAKVGTVPMMVWLRSKAPPSIGDVIQYKDAAAGRWKFGYVTCTNPLKFDQH